MREPVAQTHLHDIRHIGSKPITVGRKHEKAKLHLIDTVMGKTPCGQMIDDGWIIEQSDTNQWIDAADTAETTCGVCAGMYDCLELIYLYPRWYENSTILRALGPEQYQAMAGTI